MKEQLLCYALLLNNGLISFNKYTDFLDNAFLQNQNDKLLLELQYLSSDMHSTIRIILKECYEEKLDIKSFAIPLINELKSIYFGNLYSHEEFCKRAYSLWLILPDSIKYEKPLVILCYADDPLYWGDEEETRDKYEQLFKHYDKHESL